MAVQHSVKGSWDSFAKPECGGWLLMALAASEGMVVLLCFA